MSCFQSQEEWHPLAGRHHFSICGRHRLDKPVIEEELGSSSRTQMSYKKTISLRNEKQKKKQINSCANLLYNLLVRDTFFLSICTIVEQNPLEKNLLYKTHFPKSQNKTQLTPAGEFPLHFHIEVWRLWVKMEQFHINQNTNGVVRKNEGKESFEENLSNLWQELWNSSQSSGGFEVVSALKDQLDHLWISSAHCFLQHYTEANIYAQTNRPFKEIMIYSCTFKR